MEEVVEIIKMLITRIENLETQVKEANMNLMKSGIVVHTPRPSMTVSNPVPSGDTIAKMNWDELNELVGKLEGTI
tara:strand:- start:228 stop:452 length:225 start_codon:yes stop_codon:yes gene_type:complete